MSRYVVVDARSERDIERGAPSRYRVRDTVTGRYVNHRGYPVRVIEDPSPAYAAGHARRLNAPPAA